jgi:3-deoxy-D-manno-octulosonic-acid transferase
MLRRVRGREEDSGRRRAPSRAPDGGRTFPASTPGRRERHRLRGLQVVYDICYVLILVIGCPIVLFKLATSPRWRAGLLRRLGLIPSREGSGPCVWIHGVSVGEVLAAESLVRAFEREFPDWDIWISTTTRTGHEVARKTYAGHHLFYYPLDFSWATQRVLDRVRPDVVILMELEIWPNFLLSTWSRRIPVLLANGRISERSYRDYRILQRLIPEPLDRIRAYAVQTERYARRFLELGVPRDRIFVTGTMKFDNIPVQPDPAENERLRRVLRIAEGDRVLMGGSTHPGEGDVLLRIFRELRGQHPEARLILVPRHPERLPEVEESIRRAGFPPVRKTALERDPARAVEREAVILVDTMGELARLYEVADVVFVGGSLIPHGGQNMMEPAGLGKPVLFGSHIENFRETVDVLLDGDGAVMVRDEAELRSELARLFADGTAARDMGCRARESVLAHRGATQRMLAVFRDVLAGAPAAAGRERGTP